MGFLAVEQFDFDERVFLLQFALALVTLALLVMYLIFVVYIRQRQAASQDRYRVRIVYANNDAVEISHPNEMFNF